MVKLKQRNSTKGPKKKEKDWAQNYSIEWVE